MILLLAEVERIEKIKSEKPNKLCNASLG